MAAARRALIVAGDEYEHEGLQRLRSPQADAAALATVLGDPHIGDFDVEVVRNRPSYEVQAHIEDLFADSRPDDVLLLHLACHGLKSDSGELFFAASNTRLNRLASTAVSADFVQRCMRGSRSRSVVLLLDCCYGGAFSEGVVVRSSESVNVLDSFPSGRLEGGRGRAVITASNAMEYAFEGDRLANVETPQTSVFTSALVKGLATGEADRDEDGWVSLNELYDYVFDQVRTQNPNQTPTRDIEMQGELYLARSHRRRVQAMPLPPDLQAATEDANIFTRLGAIAELRARMIGPNLPAAAGAHQRLVEMAHGDIQYVAQSAVTTLAEVALSPDAQELDFGTVTQGSTPAPKTVHLLGPPLARACSYEESAAWIDVRETSEGFEVSVDTSTPGRLDGSIALKGQTGEADVRVLATVSVGSDSTTAPHTPTEPQGAQAAEPTLAQPADQTAAQPADQTAAQPAEPAVPPPAPPSQPASAAADAPTEQRAHRGRVDVPQRVAPLMVLSGAVLNALSLLAPYQWDNRLADLDYDVFMYSLLASLLAAATAGLALVRRVSWFVRAGILVGVAAASTWGLVLLILGLGRLSSEGGIQAGFWWGFLGQLLVVAGAILVAVATSRDPEVHLRRRPQAGRLSLALVVLGALGAVSMLVHAAALPGPGDGGWPGAATVWAALLALLVPACVAVTVPRRFATWLLVGWVVGAAVLALIYLGHVTSLSVNKGITVSSAWPATFAVSLVGLLVVADLMSRTDKVRSSGPTPPG